MFTGLIQTVGHIVNAEPITPAEKNKAGLRLRIKTTTAFLQNQKVGDSICIQGACMTATAIDGDAFTVEVSQMSLSKTTGLTELGPVNLETALRMGDAVGGHWVTGHVDATGTVHAFNPTGESWHLAIQCPASLAPFMAYKGSVAINGVSLTVNDVNDLNNGDCIIHINIIAHTFAATTFNTLQTGQTVNIEVDPIARYCVRAISAMRISS